MHSSTYVKYVKESAWYGIYAQLLLIVDNDDVSVIYKESGRFIFCKKMSMILQMFELSNYMGTVKVPAQFLVLQCDLPIFTPNLDWFMFEIIPKLGFAVYTRG